MAKRGIKYVQQDEPSFIKQFKKNVGYKEGPNVDTKREVLSRDESGSDEDDELPTVVVLKKGDISQEEYDSLKKDTDSTTITKEGEEEPSADGKIVFKKPTKKSSEQSDLNVSTKKKDKASRCKDKIKEKMDKSKGVSNKKLLSFGDEEEDED